MRNYVFSAVGAILSTLLIAAAMYQTIRNPTLLTAAAPVKPVPHAPVVTHPHAYAANVVIKR